jgi:eukaryotic-like serine/threonine-protein kinase
MIRDCKIIKELAKGGQKTVYLAVHPEAGTVVIKRGAIKSYTSLERIKREVELLSELKSDFYPQQYHFNIDIKTKEFEIVEDYIEGMVLRTAISQFKNGKDIFIFFNSLIKGLSIIWDKNIVHRDLKPENIIIRPNGMPCIIDLGIARFLDLDSLTQTISPMGPCTPIYAAPEQLTNSKNLIDPRTDFFNLGIIALELYLGVHPFDPYYVGNHYSIVENIMLNKYIVETGDVEQDEAIVEFANKTLQTQPFNRFRNYQMLNAFIAKQI